MSVLAVLVVYVLTGSAAGYLAGLFGVGGGIIIVPVLTFLFDVMGFPEDSYVQLSVGTSMAAVSVTAVFSARAHHLNGNVDWQRVRSLLPAVVIGVLLGAVGGASMSRRALILSVLAFELGVAGLFLYQTSFAVTKDTAVREVPFRTGASLHAMSSLVGAISSVVGIAGGTLFVPLLDLRGMNLKRAIGTAAALGVPIGLAAADVYVATGMATEQNLPPYSLGFVYLPAFAGCALGGISTSRHGANLGKRWSVRSLKFVFALVLLAAAARMAWGLRAS